MHSRPSNPLSWLVLMVGTLVLGCMSAGTVAAGTPKTDICHRDDAGNYRLITIADTAYQTHLAHGDKPVETFYIDADGDDFGSSSMTIEGCTAPLNPR